MGTVQEAVLPNGTVLCEWGVAPPGPEDEHEWVDQGVDTPDDGKYCWTRTEYLMRQWTFGSPQGVHTHISGLRWRSRSTGFTDVEVEGWLILVYNGAALLGSTTMQVDQSGSYKVHYYDISGLNIPDGTDDLKVSVVAAQGGSYRPPDIEEN